MEKHDIRNLDDIKLLVEAFYSKALQDPIIGYIFIDIAHLNMETHIPILCNFWNAVLFGEAGYKGNTIAKHVELNKLEALTGEHFAQWKALFHETLNEYFVGEVTELAKEKANAMIFLMKFKIDKSTEPGFIQ